MNKIKILILAANPWKTDRLSLDEEFQRIQKLYRKSNLKDKFDLLYWPAMRGEELLQEVSEFKPNLIHFSGHGESDSLVFADLSGDNPYEVTKQALGQLFKLCAPDLKGVFLNACHSAKQADAIVAQVDYVVGMNAAIDDLAAVSFSQGFYSAIFSQTELDIEQAFNAGLSQMAIAQVSEKEQCKPVLQKRRQSFVPAHEYDIAISFADKDADWTKAFSEYLQKQLNQKVFPASSPLIYQGTEFEALEAAAMLLIIASPSYLQHYSENELDKLKALSKQKTVFLIEIDSYKIPESLKGLSRHKFWLDDDQQGIMPLQGAAYIDKANQVADLVAKQLQELKAQYQHQQRTERQRQQQQECREPNVNSIDAFVFLHSAAEDLTLTTEITPVLEKSGVDYVLPLERHDDLSASDIRQDIENNILNCDAVLILYDESSLVWVREQLGTCRRLQRKRETPLKIIAVHKNQHKPELNYQLENLQIYPCPPESVQSYLQKFIGALA